VELRDKITLNSAGVSLQGELDVLEALKALGYSQNEARRALKEIPSGLGTNLDTNTKIREALKILGGK